MYKTNKYNGKKYKKKKVYSPIKDPYIISDRLANDPNTTGLDIFIEGFNLGDFAWIVFYRDILKGEGMSLVPIQFRLENIIYLTENENMQRKLYSELMDIPEYNPMIHKVPAKLLSQPLRRYVRKRQKEILENQQIVEENTFLLEHNEQIIYCTLSNDKKYQKINFKSGYGIIIYLEEKAITVVSNFDVIEEDKKYKILLNDFYEEIKKEFPDSTVENNGEVKIKLEDDFSPEKIQLIIDTLQDKIIVKEK